jgi:hypothetical protein
MTRLTLTGSSVRLQNFLRSHEVALEHVVAFWARPGVVAGTMLASPGRNFVGMRIDEADLAVHALPINVLARITGDQARADELVIELNDYVSRARSF